MTSEQEFVLALEKLPDIYIQRLVDYIDSGRRFLGHPESISWVDGKGNGCFFGVIGELDRLKAQEIAINSGFFNLIYFNDANYDKPILYQLILAEGERRGLLKKELEKMEKEIEV